MSTKLPHRLLKSPHRYISYHYLEMNKYQAINIQRCDLSQRSAISIFFFGGGGGRAGKANYMHNSIKHHISFGSWLPNLIYLIYDDHHQALTSVLQTHPSVSDLLFHRLSEHLGITQGVIWLNYSPYHWLFIVTDVLFSQ